MVGDLADGGGGVVYISGQAPSIIAGKHGNGFGCILVEDGEDTSNAPGDARGRHDTD